MHVIARAPNHLGDGVMALPALQALTQVGRLTIHAPRWGADLYRDVDAEVRPMGRLVDGDVAVLFAPSLRVAWQARHLPRRIGVPWDGRRWLLTDSVPEGAHQADTYAALASRLGAEVVGPPRYERRVCDPMPDVPEGHIGLNPISKSGAVRQWTGFADLADRVERPVFYAGPAEDDLVGPIAGRHAQQVGLSLPAFAGALSRCRLFVSNDSGAAHFARACGVETLVVYGSTTPGRTGPAGARAVEGQARCRPCYGSRCRQRWWKPGPGVHSCLDIDVEQVLAEVA